MSKYSIIPSLELDYEISHYKHQLSALETLPNTSASTKNDLRKYYQKQIEEREHELKIRSNIQLGNESNECDMPHKSVLDIPVEAEIIGPNSV
ncbi:hypothetical protein AXE80_10740 [Wenyingzhuangia fucanilytica]|uniref:Uncharacterized protein n=1 Tax=Wenyingzhuangia fucanilytica TaxID=1790137 RepID=A0A1B1Y7G3_9FLAO|nr:hypothetical protein [Wenyingzhuangia fucanilytica]ANW96720.1 hypothetical protein AXE80_10740 [Wenyingzhuangia fucanilytica]